MTDRVLVAKVGLDGHDRGVKVVEKVRDRGADIPVIVGGIIPEPDVPLLTTQGVAAVLTPGATADDVVRVVRDAIERSRAAPPGEPAPPSP